MFPSDSSTIRHPLPSAGFPRRGFPGFHGTTGCSDAPPPFRPRFLSFAWPYHASAAIFVCWPRRHSRRAATATRWARGFRGPVSPSGHRRGDDGDSQVPGGPCCVHALAFDPGGTVRAKPFRRVGVAFRYANGVGSHDCVTFRGSIPRPAHSLSTLRLRRLLSTDARLASGCRLRLAGRVGFPLGPIARFTCSSTLHSSSPRLCLAH